MKIHNKRELRNIVINHLAGLDYKDFMRIYRKCTSKPYFVFTIASTDEPDTLGDKIKANQAQ